MCNLKIPTCSLEHLTSKSEVRIRGKKMKFSLCFSLVTNPCITFHTVLVLNSFVTFKQILVNGSTAT